MSARETILKKLQKYQSVEALSYLEFEHNMDNVLERFSENAKLAGAEVYVGGDDVETTDDTFIYEGLLGVAENGAIWCEAAGEARKQLFLSHHLVLKINKKQILPTMIEAYERIDLTKSSFGVFIAGPSKTADIEQSLVLGAHGAMRMSVVLE
jgi:L-lactate dehydrogenase complex protein LldG